MASIRMYRPKTPRILITGANGIVAGVCADILKQAGFDIFGIDATSQEVISHRRRMENTNNKKPFPGKYFQVDITNYQQLEKIFQEIQKDGKLDVVLHCAAALEVCAPELITKVNIEGTKNIYQECHKYGIDVIYTSSITTDWKEYSDTLPYSLIKQGSYQGSGADIPKIKAQWKKTILDEVVENIEFTAYINSKIQGEWIAQQYVAKGISSICMRPGTVTDIDTPEENLEPRRASVYTSHLDLGNFAVLAARALIKNRENRMEASAHPYFVCSDNQLRWVSLENNIGWLPIPQVHSKKTYTFQARL